MPHRPERRRRGLRAIAIAVVAALSAGIPAAENAVVIDQPMRYINDAVITVGDVRERMAVKADELRRRGLPIPETNAELTAFRDAALEELTDEELLVQKAKELKVEVNQERLSEEVREEAKRRGLPLRAVAVLRKIRHRQSLADMIAQWFESRQEQVTPEQVRAAFRAEPGRWSRPARAQVSELALDTASDEERTRARKDHAGLFKDADAAKDERIRAAAAGRLDPFIAGSPADQDHLIDALAGELAALDPLPATAAEADRRVVARAIAVRQERARLRTVAEATALLAATAARLNALPQAKRLEAFAEEARRLGEGPAQAGGDLGWVEAGSGRPELEAALFKGVVGECSSPVVSGQLVALILVREREEARIRTLDEVSGELTEQLDRARREAIKAKAAAILRARATIRNVDLIR